jgi:hypothetical protein
MSFLTTGVALVVRYLSGIVCAQFLGRKRDGKIAGFDFPIS